jgi:hypothetical protein
VAYRSRSNPSQNLHSIDQAVPELLFFPIFGQDIEMKTYQHIIFWILVYGILTLIFASWFGGYDEAYYFVSLLLPVVMGTSYFSTTTWYPASFLPGSSENL